MRNFKKETTIMTVAIVEILEKSLLDFSVVRNGKAFKPLSMIILEPIELRANMRSLLT